MLGVWQSVPYMFCDFIGLMKGLSPERRRALVHTRSKWYRIYLAWLSLPTMLLLLVNRPVAVIVLYAMMGALFMPFLAATLLYLNSRVRWVGRELRNGWFNTCVLILCLVLFGYLGVTQLLETLNR